MSINFAVADTSFLIDWAKYSKRDLLFKLFNTVFIPESVLNEIKSEATIMWIASSMAIEKMAVFTETSELEREALQLIELSRSYPLKSIEYPEAICLALGKTRNYIVLSENGGAYAAQFAYLTEVKVWRAFEVLYELLKMKLIPKEDFYRYQNETFHLFSKQDMRKLES
jgi:predicted nucleic acid-binding protein